MSLEDKYRDSDWADAVIGHLVIGTPLGGLVPDLDWFIGDDRIVAAAALEERSLADAADRLYGQIDDPTSVLLRCSELASLYAYEDAYSKLRDIGERLKYRARLVDALRRIDEEPVESVAGDLRYEPDDAKAKSLLDIAADLIRQRTTATGFRAGIDLDNLLDGFRPGHVNIVAARPSMGKSSFAVMLANRLIDAGARVDIWSLEMSAPEMLERIAQCRYEIPRVTAENAALISEKFTELAELPLRIFDPAFATPERIASTSVDADVVIIDYLQLMGGSTENRNAEITMISRKIKMQVARGANCSVILLSQLSRAVEQRQNKRPVLSDLRDSGSIEQDADKVVFLYRPSYYDEGAGSGGETQVIVAKQRFGPTGTVRMLFDPEYSRWYDVSQDA